MRTPIILAALCCSCVATSGELERAVTEITNRVDVIARDAQESAEAVREAYRRGEINYTELQARLQDIRSATLDVSKETSREVLGELRDALEKRPEVIAETVGGLLPGPWGDLVAAIGGAAAAAIYARRRDHQQGVERDKSRIAQGLAPAEPRA